MRYPIRNAFWYLMDNWKIGTGGRAINAQLYRISGTTAAIANTEFSIKHGQDGSPVQLIPILDLSAVNAQLVPLTTSRAADAERVYLKSSVASAPFNALVEL